MQQPQAPERRNPPAGAAADGPLLSVEEENGAKANVALATADRKPEPAEADCADQFLAALRQLCARFRGDRS